MASPARRSHPLLPTNGSSGSRSSTPLRAVAPTTKDDPLQPLRTMADRVGKEVEKFAERVDYWHLHKTEDQRHIFHSTLHMVGKFKDLADSTVKELKKQSGAENKGELQKSTRRRIQDMAASTRADREANDNSSSQSVVPSIETSTIPKSTRVQELRHWQTEAATWDLLHLIIQHYHPEPGVDVAAEKRSRLAKVGGAYRYSPNHEIWDRFILEDDEAQEKELILRWLERSARNTESDIESITEQLEDESGKGTNTWTSGFLDTKSQIKQAKRLQSTDKPLPPNYAGLRTRDRTELLVTQLDPDAPGRQKRALEKSDEYYDRALWMVCYEMLRRGYPWEEISEWCRERSEGWRGVSIGAACESHSEGVPNISGPTVGYLYRRMCFYAAKGAKTQYESAVYGMLSGDLKEVIPVCRSWEDHLYAHYNALLLSRFDSYLLKNHSQKISQTLAQRFVFQDAVANLGRWETSSQEVVELLKRQKSTAALSLLPMKLIQGSLIGGTIEELILKVGYSIYSLLKLDNRPTSLMVDPQVLGSFSDTNISSGLQSLSTEKYHEELATEPHALRVLVHIHIVLSKALGAIKSTIVPEVISMDNVIAAYIEFLRITKRFQLIPLYAAQLSSDRTVACLARVLPDIKNEEEQKGIIRLMDQYGIDPVDVVCQNYVLTAQRLYGGDDPKLISKLDLLEHTGDAFYPGKRVKDFLSGLKPGPDEEALIDTLRWQIHLSRDVEQTFSILHSALIYLLRAGHIGAAIQVTTELSVENLSFIKTQALCGYAFDFTVPGTEVQDTTRTLSSPRRTSLRPSDIPSAAEHRSLVLQLRGETGPYFELQQFVHLIHLFGEWREEEDNIIKQQQAGTKRNLMMVKDLFDSIESNLYPLLASFLANPDAQNHEDAARIRHLYIPEIVLAFICVVQSMSQFGTRDTSTKAMDLATLIADEDNSWLQNVFMETGRMTELVDMLALTSRKMLQMVEDGGKPRSIGGKKRGNRGETNRIWDLNVRN
ncbi:nuclear pore complex protein-like protein Nup107 [Lophiostoma macrostomum CBS 122681]|uniref:Nuclear pore complex protein n=1 Tax=Lophiostoma macrostomum CBS 122681 TaxID=1314788 RepID=A0A6A6TH45_9PLEO|nr:nuclear pore complex protein-like protein Nup107 [Lophiostoma macrostomum CBS 122681]